MSQFVKSTTVTEAVGSIKPFGGATAPSGWLVCDGTAVSRTTYANLFAIIATTWGVGDGSTTFNVPDMIGASAVGVGTSTGYTSNETVALGTKYDDKFQSHTHNDAKLNSGNEGVVMAVRSDGLGSALGFGIGIDSGWDYFINSIPRTDGNNGTPRTGSVTKGKTVGVNYIIKY